MSLTPEDFIVSTLGKGTVPSPLDLSNQFGDGLAHYVPERTRVLYKTTGEKDEDFDVQLFLERAGPREFLHFEPSKVRAAMVTCGGMSPGLNNVLRSIFLELHHRYQVPEIWGFKYGFRGMNAKHGNEPVRMTREFVRTIHNDGGSALGVSRGREEPSLLVDRLVEMGINVFFCIGGDGTLRGANAIWEEIRRRKLDIAVVVVPKTIDNDIPFVYKTFGFDTAVGIVRQAIDGAHVESVGSPNGIGIVKVMGRDAGFIAAYGTLASMEVNYCLVPEVPFGLYGADGLLAQLEVRVRERGHVVIVAAEGAGQYYLEGQPVEYDASGNRIHHDIGVFLRDRITRHFRKTGMMFNIKYIDPSYMIRSVRANASDAILCDDLARNAVHAAMAGKTDVLIGLWHGSYVHVPIALVTRSPRKRIHPESYLWRAVLQATGQPSRLGDPDAETV